MFAYPKTDRTRRSPRASQGPLRTSASQRGPTLAALGLDLIPTTERIKSLSLTAPERETVITFSDADDTATIHTHQRRIITKLLNNPAATKVEDRRSRYRPARSLRSRPT